jgi:hypothetical protein
MVSQDKFDHRQMNIILHKIMIKMEEPVYIQQFKIPDAHQEEVKKHCAESLKLGIIQPDHNKFNTSIFANGQEKRTKCQQSH